MRKSCFYLSALAVTVGSALLLSSAQAASNISTVQGVPATIAGVDAPLPVQGGGPAPTKVQPSSIVYDYTGSTGSGFVLAQPRPTLSGDAGTMTMPALGPNEMYQIDSVTVARVHGTATGSFDVGFAMYDNAALPSAATTPEFSGLMALVSFNRAVTAANAGQVFVTTIPFAPGALLTDDLDFGFEMYYAAPGTISHTGDTVNYTPTTLGIGAFYPDQGPTLQGVSDDYFFLDDNGDKVITQDEATGFGTPNESFSNVFLQINASIVAVPEPASMGLLGLSVLALSARRRKQ